MAADFTLFEIRGFLLGQLYQWIHCISKGILAPHPEPMVFSVSTRVHGTTGQQCDLMLPPSGHGVRWLLLA